MNSKQGKMPSEPTRIQRHVPSPKQRHDPTPKSRPIHRTSSMEAQREPLAFEVFLDDKAVEKINVQAALQEKRPDFVLSSEERRKIIQEMAYLRQVEKTRPENIPRLFSYQQLRKHTEDIYRNLPDTKKEVLKKVRKEKEKTYRVNANDFQKVNFVSGSNMGGSGGGGGHRLAPLLRTVSDPPMGSNNRFECVLLNLINVFALQKLQSQVLQGQVNFPHTKCLL